MKLPLLLAFGLCLSLTMPALAQRPGGQQQQKQQKSKQETRKGTKQKTQQKKQPQPRTQQQQKQQVEQHNRPQVHQQDRQQQTRPRDRQSTQPQVLRQERQRTQPQAQRQDQRQSQRQMRPHSRERYTPQNAPRPRAQRNQQPRYYRAPNGRIDRRPIYRNGVWYGRAAPNDSRFRLRRPFAQGRFFHYGPRFYHRIVRFSRAHYWFWLSSGYYFQIAYWDWPYCSNWCWTCGDEYLIYLDPDHYGWYLILNVQTGVYVHATFMGMWR